MPATIPGSSPGTGMTMARWLDVVETHSNYCFPGRAPSGSPLHHPYARNERAVIAFSRCFSLLQDSLKRATKYCILT